MNKNNSRKKIKPEEIYAEVIERLTAAGYKDNWVHGLPHIKRVRKNYKLLLRHGKLPANIAKCLLVAVNIHDIGRTSAGNHAENSARIFKQMKISDFSEKEKADIEFALKNHNKGLVTLGIVKPKADKEILLGLLCALDHLDGIGKIGILRSYQWIMETQKKPKILSHLPVKTLKKYLRNGYITTKMRKAGLKAESVLVQLIYNYLATDEIVNPIKNLLEKKFLRIIEFRQKELWQEIDFLIKLAEENKKV